MRATTLVVLTGLLVGCGRLGFDLTTDGSTTDTSSSDTITPDVSAVTVCDLVAEPDVVALYGFEGGAGTDTTGQHSGTPSGTITSTTGRCGSLAASFNASYVLVPDSPDFELATGSIELFARTADPTGVVNQAMITRDAGGTVSEGHFTVLTNTAGAVIVRIQRGGASYYRCAPVLASNQWVHVGVSFGGTAAQGFRMWVDHVEATNPTGVLDGGAIDCTGVLPAGGLEGNNNALVIAGSNAIAPDGAADPNVNQFWIGDLDQVRIRSTWRDFSAP